MNSALHECYYRFYRSAQKQLLGSWQQEYVDMTSRSALSMMRNIENLLELMQVESGSVYMNLSPFNPWSL